NAAGHVSGDDGEAAVADVCFLQDGTDAARLQQARMAGALRHSGFAKQECIGVSHDLCLERGQSRRWSAVPTFQVKSERDTAGNGAATWPRALSKCSSIASAARWRASLVGPCALCGRCLSWHGLWLGSGLAQVRIIGRSST